MAIALNQKQANYLFCKYQFFSSQLNDQILRDPSQAQDDSLLHKAANKDEQRKTNIVWDPSQAQDDSLIVMSRLLKRKTSND